MAHSTADPQTASTGSQERRDLLSFVAGSVAASELRISRGNWVPLDFAGVRSRLEDATGQARPA